MAALKRRIQECPWACFPSWPKCWYPKKGHPALRSGGPRGSLGLSLLFHGDAHMGSLLARTQQEPDVESRPSPVYMESRSESPNVLKQLARMLKPDTVVHVYDSSAREAESRG